MYIINSEINSEYYTLYSKIRKAKLYFVSIYCSIFSILIGITDSPVSKYLTLNISDSELDFFQYILSILTPITFLALHRQTQQNSINKTLIICEIFLFVLVSSTTFVIANVPINLTNIAGFLTGLFAYLSCLFLPKKHFYCKKNFTTKN